MDRFVYQNEKTKEISFPLGGIGSGCVGLAGNGRLVDVEIFGKPNKGSHAAFTHFAVKAQEDNAALVDARIINGDVPPPYSGQHNRPHFNSYGHGVDRSALAGMPHFSCCNFKGEFPIASLDFCDDSFPGKLTMTAFNPFIPLCDDDSSIPGAFFSFKIENTTNKPLTYTVAFTAGNLYGNKGGMHAYSEKDGIKTVTLSGESGVGHGDMTIGTDAHDSDHQLYWYRGNWFDNLATFWRDFTSPGPIRPRSYPPERSIANANFAADDMATLLATVRVEPGQSDSLRFVWTWNTPLCYNYWKPEVGTESFDDSAGGCNNPKEGDSGVWKHYYATLFVDSLASCRYSVRRFNYLYGETKRFHDALFSSTLPPEVLDAVSANLANIKSPTCLRLQDGSLYGFEGCHCDSGCCEGSCTHVWGYSYAIPFLFPKLERSMRTLEYTYSMDEHGGMSFRLQLPLGRAAWSFRPCVDGQYVTVMRVLREYKLSGDKNWLCSIWPMVKRSIEYAWSPNNEDRWDADCQGVMSGRQHHTLDMELFGANSWLSGLYLGGLKAGADLAHAMEDTVAEAKYLALYQNGRKIVNQQLFNGDYFFQRIDLTDRSLLDPFIGGKLTRGQEVHEAYWNEEQQELMYQIGDGCGIDQVLAQWHANLIGIGEIFDRDKVRSALHSIYKHNFIPKMRNNINPCRIYSLNDESGLIICQWPEGTHKPLIPVPYSEETMNGFEYQAACHMIQEGMLEEGLNCVRAIRERYDGEKRNPWNEFECGSNYARSMASYSLLLAFSGFSYDLPNNQIGFSPVCSTDDFSCFWSVGTGWGTVQFSNTQVSISVAYGQLALKTVNLQKAAAPSFVMVDDSPVAFEFSSGTITLSKLCDIKQGLTVLYK